ncbi:MAG: DUF456 domain-containing protein [Actinomycetota bacterium]|nr:DUF456 domain-containing protein [Actinomycetota bacterium]
MSGLDLLVALIIAVGLVGILLPMLPGSWLVGGAILVWAGERAATAGWVVAAIAVGWLVAGAVGSYVVPGRRLKAAGIPTSTLLVAGLLGIAGFFVVPVIGVVLGFVLGIYLAELSRLRSRTLAWPVTKNALRAVFQSIAIELTAALLATLTWVAGVLLT